MQLILFHTSSDPQEDYGQEVNLTFDAVGKGMQKEREISDES